MIMKWLVPLASLFAAVAFASAACDTCLDSYCYSKINLANNVSSYRIAIDNSTNTLHFATYSGKSYSYNLKNFTSKTTSYKNIRTFAIHGEQREVYGTTLGDGIYKLDAADNEFKPFALLHANVYLLYCKDKIYFSLSYQKGVCILNSSESYEKIEALNKYSVQSFIVDKHDDIYFMFNESNVYRLKKGAKSATNFLVGDYTVLSTDSSNNAIFMKSDSRMYRLNEEDGVDFIGALDTVPKTIFYDYQVVFDSNNNVVHNDWLRSTLHYYKRDVNRCRIIVTENNNMSIVVDNHIKEYSTGKIYYATEASGVPDINTDSGINDAFEMGNVSKIEYVMYTNSGIEVGNVTEVKEGSEINTAIGIGNVTEPRDVMYTDNGIGVKRGTEIRSMNETEDSNVTEVENGSEIKKVTEAVNATVIKLSDRPVHADSNENLSNKVSGGNNRNTWLSGLLKSNFLIILKGNFNFTVNESGLNINTK